MQNDSVYNNITSTLENDDLNQFVKSSDITIAASSSSTNQVSFN